MNDVIMRAAIKEDITLDNVVFIKGDDGQLHRKVIEEVLKPSDSFKGFCADDGCRYGLYECYVDDSDTKMTDVKRYVGNETQCEPAIMVDGKIITVDDHQALQAENERLKVLLARHNDGVLRLIGLSDKRERVRVGENMREETPEMMQPVINKLKADAVMGFSQYFSSKFYDVPSGRFHLVHVEECAHDYANKLEAVE